VINTAPLAREYRLNLQQRNPIVVLRRTECLRKKAVLRFAYIA
jgi:hypothetical protein